MKTLPEEHEEMAKRVAKRIHERRKMLRERFGTRKYGDVKPSADEQRAIWNELRLNPVTMEEEYRTAQAEAGLSPGLLPRRFIEDVFRYERERR